MRVHVRTMEAYKRNHVREDLLLLAMDDDPRPMILSGRYIPHVRRNGKRVLIYAVKPFAKEDHGKKLLPIADHLWIKESADAMKRMVEGHAKDGESTPRIYIVGYPEPYKSGSIERCGFRLAFDVMEKPFCIEWNPNFLDEASKLAYLPTSEKFLIWPDPYPSGDASEI